LGVWPDRVSLLRIGSQHARSRRSSPYSWVEHCARRQCGILCPVGSGTGASRPSVSAVWRSTCVSAKREGWKPVRLKSAILVHFVGGALCPQAMRKLVSGWVWNWSLQTVGPNSVEVDACLGKAGRLEASTPEVGDPRPFHGWSTVSAGDAVDCVRLDLELVPSVSWSQQCRGRRVSRRSEKVGSQYA